MQCYARKFTAKITYVGALLLLGVTSSLPKSKMDWFRISRFLECHLILEVIKCYN